MDPIVFTPRLKLTLVTQAERGSPELEWLHRLRSDEKVTTWSIWGQSKTLEDTEKVVKGVLPTGQAGDNTYRVSYAVHQILGEPQTIVQGDKQTEFIGMVSLWSCGDRSLPLPENLTIPAAAATTTLTVELGYMFLPNSWGKGYAAESLTAVLNACKRAPMFWSPFSKVYMRAIVNDENPASLRVMAKAGVPEKGLYEWTGDKIFLGGRWRERDNLHIFGKYLLE
ncbi:hypothetical protein K461DRAFT_240577 [Myriangium duriaei CBS 260.36]|uniref:N-acetyltransferase domain-containing protein n=1 Tax=Myriangium duriaei CBS 260.36 TaxID=1168546 RepID=A0A9P4J2C3_9PEZI|nr:hypothetical protein K461DRAFT_240577 [Myriangium duriaei CBS 260.36]